ncbi:hypothetical protein CRYUN_Cryun04dG0087800 [Craigia yunnanensis]
MAFLVSFSSTFLSFTCSYPSSQFLSRPEIGSHPYPPPPLLSIPHLIPRRRPNLSQSLTAAAARSGGNAVPSKNPKENKKDVVGKDTDEVEVEEELPWIQEKALDLVEFTGSVTQAIPGPRVGTSSLPWILAVPLAYAGITFVIAFVKTVKKFTSPRHKRKKLVNKNAMLCKSIDELFQRGSVAVDQSALKGLVQKTGFSTEEILRKYIRYSLNEKPWSADLVASLIQLKKASMLDDSQIAEILNEISRRIVREKGSVVMDMSGFTEKGFKRKLAVQGLFGKVLYLSEVCCSTDSFRSSFLMPSFLLDFVCISYSNQYLIYIDCLCL